MITMAPMASAYVRTVVRRAPALWTDGAVTASSLTSLSADDLAAFTEGNRGALQALIPHALTQGVTRAEILQVIQLGAHLAVHGASLGATVYTKVVADNRNGPGKADATA